MYNIFRIARNSCVLSASKQRLFTNRHLSRTFTSSSSNVSNTFGILGLLFGTSAFAYTGYTIYQIYGRNQSWFIPYRYQTIKFGANIEEEKSILEDKILEEVLFVASPTFKSSLGLPLNIVKYKVNQVSGPPPKRIVTGFNVSGSKIERESREILLHSNGDATWEDEFSYSFQGELTISGNERGATSTIPDSGTIYFTAKIPVHDLSQVHLQKAHYIARRCDHSPKSIDLLSESNDVNLTNHS
ncbi:hypothetical protein K7432_003307 [Basidiobolus ranarum]|uniref:Uncharacterized protein n=1 Tax=Basidiobolus ranarum TaxID=34480 RepID=A0ABR2W797_9FUNG